RLQRPLAPNPVPQPTPQDRAHRRGYYHHKQQLKRLVLGHAQFLHTKPSDKRGRRARPQPVDGHSRDVDSQRTLRPNNVSKVQSPKSQIAGFGLWTLDFGLWTKLAP